MMKMHLYNKTLLFTKALQVVNSTSVQSQFSSPYFDLFFFLYYNPLTSKGNLTGSRLACGPRHLLGAKLVWTNFLKLYSCLLFFGDLYHHRSTYTDILSWYNQIWCPMSIEYKGDTWYMRGCFGVVRLSFKQYKPFIWFFSETFYG